MLTSKDSFSHFIKAEIEEFYKISLPECNEQKQLIYTLSHYLLGVYKKKLYINRLSGEVVNYKVSHFLFNVRIF